MSSLGGEAKQPKNSQDLMLSLVRKDKRRGTDKRNAV